MWIWQNSCWPQFSYNMAEVVPVLEEVVRAVAPLNLLAAELDQKRRLQLESKVLLKRRYRPPKSRERCWIENRYDPVLLIVWGWGK